MTHSNRNNNKNKKPLRSKNSRNSLSESNRPFMMFDFNSDSDDELNHDDQNTAEDESLLRTPRNGLFGRQQSSSELDIPNDDHSDIFGSRLLADSHVASPSVVPAKNILKQNIAPEKSKECFSKKEKSPTLLTEEAPVEEVIILQHHNYLDAHGNSRQYYLTNKDKKVFIVKANEEINDKVDFIKLGIVPATMEPGNYTKVGEKEGGINLAGDLGGNHVFYYTFEGQLDAKGKQVINKQMLVLKQDNGFLEIGSFGKTGKIQNIPKHAKYIWKNPRYLVGKIPKLKKLAGTPKPLPGKVIGEFIAGSIMNAMSGNSASSVFYTLVPPDTPPDRSSKNGENVYIGSIFYDNYQDLTADIERVLKLPILRIHHNEYKRITKAGSKNKHIFIPGILETNKHNEVNYYDRDGNIRYTAQFKPNQKIVYRNENRKKISENDVKKIYGKPRYRFHDTERVALISILLGDFDIHSGNLGVITERKRVNRVLEGKGNLDKYDFERDAYGNIIRDKYEKIGRLVKIDHGAALHHLHDEVNPHSSSEHPWGVGPTNHYRELPRELRVSKETAEEAERLANYDKEDLKRVIETAIKESAAVYGATPFNEFVEHRLGMDVKKLFEATPDLYKKLQIGALTTTEDDSVKATLVAASIEFLQQKMLNRMESLRKYAFEIKLSLCVKYQRDGTFKLDNSDYNIEDVLHQYPQYVTAAHLRFRSPDQKISKTFGKNTYHPDAKAIAAKGFEESIIKTAQRVLGNDLKVNTSNYSITFYKKVPDTESKDQALKVPAGVYHVIASENTLKIEYPKIYAKQKTTAPHITTEDASRISTLKPNQVAINFVESTSRAGNSGYYVEHFTKNNQYMITAHRLPPEVDKTVVLSSALIKLSNASDPLRLRSKPQLVDTIKEIAHLITINDGKLSDGNLDQEQIELLTSLGGKKSTLDETKALLKRTYLTATETKVHSSTGEEYLIPSKSYLEFAEKQCQSFYLNQGQDAVIRILPRDHEDPLMVKAMVLVCAAHTGWGCKNRSQYSQTQANANAINRLMNPDVLQKVRELLNITSPSQDLSPPPSPTHQAKER